MESNRFVIDKIFNNLFDQAVVVNRDYRILLANKAFTDAFGIELDSLKGCHCFEILNHLDQPCSTKNASCPLVNAFETRSAQYVKHTHNDSKRNETHYRIRAVPLIDEAGNFEQVALILRNETQSIRAENKLLEASRRFRLITDMGNDAILILGSDYQVEFANSVASRLTGYSYKEMMHLDFRSFLDEMGKNFLEEHVKSDQAKNRQAKVRLKIRTLSGTPRYCEIYINPAQSIDGEIKTYVFLRDLSKQMQMEKELRQANRFLTNLIDSSVDGIIAADMNGKVIIFNEGAEKLLGYKTEEVIDNFSVVNFYPPGVAQDIMRKLLSEDWGGKGKVLPMRITGIHKNGEHIPMTLSGALIYQGGKEVASVGIFYDLREILKAEQDLLQSETNFRNLFERVQHGIYFSTREGRFLDCNRAMLEMLGYEEKADFLKMDITRDLYENPDDRAVFQEMIEKDGFVKDYEARFKKKNCELVNVLMTAHVRKDTGQIQGYQGILIDVTESRKLKQQLFQSEKLAAMGRLTAQIAHELNNPIFGVMNCLDLIKSEVPEGNKKRKFLDMAYEETKRISQLLRSMLKFFRPAEDVKGETDLNKLIEEVVLFIGKQLAEFRIKVDLELDKDLPTVFASGNQLKQVLLNMIMNAKTAMPQGGNLLLSTHLENESVEIKISDTGSGIPKENLDRIFEAFFTTKSDVKGVGLGLSVCFGIIREHNGKIEVESEIERGTTFIITLPVKS